MSKLILIKSVGFRVKMAYSVKNLNQNLSKEKINHLYSIRFQINST